MLKRTLGTAGVLIVLAGAAFAFSPAIRAKLTGQWDRMAGWSKAAREADPVGFVKYAEAKLKKDLEKMETLRRGLAAEVGTITKKTRQQSALAEQAQMLAEEFRGAYQQAKAGGGFPIEVRGEAYTEPQVRSQVSLLLAESEGYADSLGEMVDVRGEAQERMEELTVRIGKTESQLAGLAAKRELLRARKLTLEGEELLAQVDELMVANRQAVAGNPIRTATELVAAGRKSSKTRASEQKVEAFLAGTYSAKPLPKLSVSSFRRRFRRRSFQNSRRNPPPRKPSRSRFRSAVRTSRKRFRWRPFRSKNRNPPLRSRRTTSRFRSPPRTNRRKFKRRSFRNKNRNRWLLRPSRSRRRSRRRRSRRSRSSSSLNVSGCSLGAYVLERSSTAEGLW